MLLLFVVSGMSARFYLENHTDKEFRTFRTVKLLVPSIIGLFVFQWILGYYNTCMSGVWNTMPNEVSGIVKYLIMVASGTGVLWYIQLLWVFSMLLLVVRKLENSPCDRCFGNIFLTFDIDCHETPGMFFECDYCGSIDHGSRFTA